MFDINKITSIFFNDSAVPLGRDSGLKCSCGGPLHKFDPVTYNIIKNMKMPRYSRKKRLRKKFIKKWRIENIGDITLLMMNGMRPHGFKCGKCQRREGFYDSIARNIIKLEPLPEGALPVYSGNIDDNEGT